MPPSRPMKTPKSVIDLICPEILSPLLWVARELLPRVGGALFHAQRDSTTLGVDVENHDLDLVPDLAHLVGMNILVRPVHFRDVHQAFDTLLEFHERTVIGDVGDLAEQARALRVTPREILPGIVAELLETQRYPVLFPIELEHLDLDFLPDFQHLGRMLDTTPGDVGNVQQAVQALRDLRTHRSR